MVQASRAARSRSFIHMATLNTYSTVAIRIVDKMTILSSRRVYYGWANLSVAALAMVGTLPGRTQGLGLITEPLLKDLQLDRVLFAQINLWATLLGSLFCLGIGRLLDRVGSRIILTIVALMLGAVVLLM